jgi:hypothetical protein
MKTEGRFSALRNWRSIEQISYWLVWLILLFLPLIFWDFNDPQQQKRLIGGWVRILPFFFIFLIHNFILLPYLLLKRRYLAYGILTVILILGINYWFIFSDSLHNIIINLMEGRQEKLNEMAEHLNEQRNWQHNGEHEKGYQGAQYWKWHNPSWFVFTYNSIISLLVAGFNAAMKYITQNLNREQLRKELEKETAESQLMVLQNQVSPHFFMNTLNNIHALIDYNREDAKEAVLRLSKMMRYLLYESDNGRTSLKKEIEFLASYIDLMRLRLQPEVDLRVNFPDPVPEVEIYSLLTISFLENAFKYGIDPRAPSFIHILLEADENRIHFNVRNSKTLKGEGSVQPGGLGIENARKRLDLLYGKQYSLKIYNRDLEYEVDLIYPVS